ncbi:MAG TPA: tRNA (adenosine(37)-N6)-threonylcarbamoyltransferase complex dimerization subunit type 1 TsaB [Candidatus Binatia bacterium]|nr:tRNA (adenosine(37)-N6)-threonylcarbamoyltransferase complex dimerization subunit type 1 TsaB [Candidatus Binatia bacterium]
MKILAFEFSSAQRSVAVATADGKIVSATGNIPERTTRAFALIEEAFAKGGIGRNEIDCIAVGLGPGSYTGVRVAISIAQGWQLARGVKLLGLSSIDAIAERARLNGVKGRVTCVVDAQRQEFYVAPYDLSVAPARPIQSLHIETLAQVKERAAGGELLIGPEQSLPGNHLIFPDAEVLAKLGTGRSDFLSGDKLEPIYLRETAFVKAPPPRFPVPAK